MDTCMIICFNVTPAVGMAPWITPSYETSVEVSVQLPPVSTLPLKEGIVEKRGHSAAFLMWPK